MKAYSTGRLSQDPGTLRAASIQSQRIFQENMSNVPTEIASKRNLKIYIEGERQAMMMEESSLEQSSCCQDEGSLEERSCMGRDQQCMLEESYLEGSGLVESLRGQEYREASAEETEDQFYRVHLMNDELEELMQRYREVMPEEDEDVINRLATSQFKELVRDSSNELGESGGASSDQSAQ